MSKDNPRERQPKPDNNPKSNPESDGKRSWIGEDKANYDRLRKGMEIPPPTPTTSKGKKK